MNNNVVLTFHAIQDQLWFERTIEFLIANYKIITTDELYLLMNGKKRFKNIVHITIDDAHRSFYDIIFPILKKYNVPATLFVSPKIIEERSNFWFQLDKGLDQEKMIQIISDEVKIPVSKLINIPYHYVIKCMTIDRIYKILSEYYVKNNTPVITPQNISVDQLIEIEKSGLVTIGAHTLTHPILRNESDYVVDNEISDSINKLKLMLGRSVDYFAYPNGQPGLDFGQREIKILRNNNIKLAFAGEHRTFNWGSDTLCIPRIGFSYGTTKMLRMKIIMGYHWSHLKAFQTLQEEKLRKRVYNLIYEN